MYVEVYVYGYVYVHVYVYGYVYIHVYVYVYMYAYLLCYVCVYVYVYVNINLPSVPAIVSHAGIVQEEAPTTHPPSLPRVKHAFEPPSKSEYVTMKPQTITYSVVNMDTN